MVFTKDLALYRLAAAKQDKAEAQDVQSKMKERLEREFERKIEFSELKDLPNSIEALNDEINELEPRLCVSENSVTAASVREYQNVSKELDSYERQKHDVETRLRKVDEDFDTTLARWRPSAEEVMKTIDQSFRNFIESIGCAGQVSLRLPEDTVRGHFLHISELCLGPIGSFSSDLSRLLAFKLS
jgi:chromosome segregation ATPase